MYFTPPPPHPKPHLNEYSPLSYRHGNFLCKFLFPGLLHFQSGTVKRADCQHYAKSAPTSHRRGEENIVGGVDRNTTAWKGLLMLRLTWKCFPVGGKKIISGSLVKPTRRKASCKTGKFWQPHRILKAEWMYVLILASFQLQHISCVMTASNHQWTYFFTLKWANKGWPQPATVYGTLLADILASLSNLKYYVPPSVTAGLSIMSRL